MNKLYLSFLISSLALVSHESQAIKTLADCQAKDSTLEEYSMCLDRVKERVDRELQTWVNNQTFELEELAAKSGRKAPLNMFKRSQKNFITYRENNCRWQYLATPPSSEEGAVAYKSCHIFLNQNRIKELSIQSIPENNKQKDF